MTDENKSEVKEVVLEPVQNSDSAEKNELASKGDVPQKELNGPKGLEPTRYGDWESKGRCYDF